MPLKNYCFDFQYIRFFLKKTSKNACQNKKKLYFCRPKQRERKCEERSLGSSLKA